MTMKVIKPVNVTELKANLSRYLRLASRGARITVKDRDEPIAELGPPRTEELSWRDRLTREGRLRTGSQNWAALKISTLSRRVDIQASLRAVREDPDEVRRRERGASDPVR
jgi:antitoxin (DNA-binding transcriptional repressor) of toxin-antitoxin stability system